MNVIDAVTELLQRDAAVRKAYAENPAALKHATFFRERAARVCEELGVTLIRSFISNNVQGFILPKNFNDWRWLTLTATYPDDVSEPGLPEDITGGLGEDPFIKAMKANGLVVDYEDWIKRPENDVPWA